MKSAAINRNSLQIPNGSLGADPRSRANVLHYCSADLDTAASGSDVSIKDFISGSSFAGGDSGNRGASINATGGPTGKRAYDFSTGVYNLGNFNSQASNFAFTIVSKVTDTDSSGQGTIAFKNPSGFGFGGDFKIEYKVNIPTLDLPDGRVISNLNFTSEFGEPENRTVQNMLRSYHVMTIVQANGKMTLRFNGQQHRQVDNPSGLTTNLDFLLGDDTATGSSDAGKFITPEFVIYTLNDTTSFSDVINIEKYLQRKYRLTFKPIS
jgi:hypothetical protein